MALRAVMVKGRTALVGVLAWMLSMGPAGLPTQARAAVTQDEVVEKLQSTCSQIQDLRAQFHQTATNRSLGQVQEASGLFLVKRPGKMRWEYQKPEPRLFVTDGKTLWVFSPGDKQVVVQSLDQAFTSRTPLSFLAGDCQLRRDFNFTTVEHAGTRASPASMILDLRPKQAEAGIARMLLEVNLQTYVVEKTTVFDAVGNTTVIALTNVKLNVGLGDQQFQFTPPAGVTVVTPPTR
jgi:outer membrane lipoprotein carrier protein